MYKKLRGCAPCAVAGALGSHTTLSVLRVLAATAPAPCHTPLTMHKNRSSTFNSIQPLHLRYTTHFKLETHKTLCLYESH